MILLHVQHGIHHESEIEMEIGKSDKVRAAVTRVHQIERVKPEEARQTEF